MRELKFRAWNKHLKVMKANIHLLDNCNEYFNNDNQDVMQFVGLKDKNGKEVYVGDILHSPTWGGSGRKSPHDNHVVEWHSGNAAWVATGYNGTVEVSPSVTVRRDFVVIGNVWENPELLQPKAA